MATALIEKLAGPIEKALGAVLQEGEVVEVKLAGAFKEGLICTDRRVIIIKGGFMTGQMFGTDAFQVPYSSVAGVQVKFTVLSGYFELSAAGMQNTAKNYWSQQKNVDPKSAPNCVSLTSKASAQRFREACNWIISKKGQLGAAPPVTQPASQNSILDAIAKLGDLQAAGVLTVAEFESKKAELLSRL